MPSKSAGRREREHVIKESRREIEIKQQRQKVDVHAYLQDCWVKGGFYTAEADSTGLEEGGADVSMVSL